MPIIRREWIPRPHAPAIFFLYYSLHRGALPKCSVIIIMCSSLPLPSRALPLSRTTHSIPMRVRAASDSVLHFQKLIFSLSLVLSSIELYLLISPLLHAFFPFTFVFACIFLIIVQFCIRSGSPMAHTIGIHAHGMAM